MDLENEFDISSATLFALADRGIKAETTSFGFVQLMVKALELACGENSDPLGSVHPSFFNDGRWGASVWVGERSQHNYVGRCPHEQDSLPEAIADLIFKLFAKDPNHNEHGTRSTG